MLVHSGVGFSFSTSSWVTKKCTELVSCCARESRREKNEVLAGWQWKGNTGPKNVNYLCLDKNHHSVLKVWFPYCPLNLSTFIS